MVPFAVVSGKSIIAGTSVAFCGSRRVFRNNE